MALSSQAHPESTRIYSFAGTSSGYNTSFQNYFVPPDTTYGLWFYDFETTVWTAVNTLAQGITIPSHGATAEAVDQGLGFYLGGQIDNGTAADTSLLKSPVAIPGMIVVTPILDVWPISLYQTLPRALVKMAPPSTSQNTVTKVS